MVVFTCSHCGDSLKKPAVRKHYDTKCRKKTPFLTCVDCLKDFKGDEFNSHAQCLTEHQRYSAKGSSAVPVASKGQKKQRAWTDCFKLLLETDENLKADERTFLEEITTFENFPRKRVKFNNFLKNSFRKYVPNVDLVDRVWKKLEELHNKPEPGSQDKTTENGQAAAADPLISNGHSKKRKRDSNGLKDVAVRGDPVDGERHSEKKKKKSKRKHEGEGGDVAEEEGSGKGKKRKRKDSETEVIPIDEDPGAGKDTGKKRKKKKKKKEEEEEREEECPETCQLQAKEGHLDTSAQSDSGSFPWGDTIITILTSDGSDEPIALKKLKKKVLKKYGKALNVEADEKAERKFMKKLKKMNNVVVNNEFVSLKR